MDAEEGLGGRIRFEEYLASLLFEGLLSRFVALVATGHFLVGGGFGRLRVWNRRESRWWGMAKLSWGTRECMP
jgi:hypothetical protein